MGGGRGRHDSCAVLCHVWLHMFCRCAQSSSLRLDVNTDVSVSAQDTTLDTKWSYKFAPIGEREQSTSSARHARLQECIRSAQLC